MTVWLPCMYRDEAEMLTMRLEETAAWPAKTVLVESAVTHRGHSKPLHYAAHKDRFRKWNDSIIHVIATGLSPSVPGEPEPDAWANEHAQRNRAWPVIDRLAEPGDTVIIGDVDEIPSPSLMDWQTATGRRFTVIAARMTTCLFAVDWLVPDAVLPPTCVAATVPWLRSQAAKGRGLAEVRDRRGDYFELRDGGWHFSWLGGVEAQQQKLLTSTCHVELLGSKEGGLILTGERYRSGEHAEGHLPVVPADVDESWPAMIRERRCPAEWFRPRQVPARSAILP